MRLYTYLTAAILIVLVLLLVGCDSDTNVVDPVPIVHPVQPVAQPITAPTPAPQVQPLIAPAVQGKVSATQLWVTNGHYHPQPVINLEYTLDWVGNADGYDILVWGQYEGTVITGDTYVFTRQHIGELSQTDLGTLLAHTLLRAWRDPDEVLSNPVAWVY